MGLYRRLCCRANFIFAAALTLRGHKADLFHAYWLIIFWSFLFLVSDAMQFEHFLWRIIIYEFVLERIRSTLPECKSVRWINNFLCFLSLQWFRICVRGTRTVPLICVGCSVPYWASCAINKADFFENTFSSSTHICLALRRLLTICLTLTR